MLKELLQHAAASDQDIVSTKGEIETCRAELERLWAEDDGLGAEYELASVFIHLGAAGFGHYYLHQRALPSQPERWLKFNDSTVGVIAFARMRPALEAVLTEVLRQCPTAGHGHTPLRSLCQYHGPDCQSVLAVIRAQGRHQQARRCCLPRL